ncbi:MAG: serine hydrolase [Chloroflexota bacterium]|nr:serine hydrolase [Chloroflexota bacterium]
MSGNRSVRLLWAVLLLLSALPLSLLSASAQDAPATPSVSAQSIYVFDATLNIELLAENAEEQRAPASTVKIVTAMVVLDHAELDTELVFLEEDTATEDESRMGLVEGDTLTVEQLLYGLMLPSGNDAARTLARHVGELLLDGEAGDPIERFVQAMNDKVVEAGLSNTNFTSPDGLSDDPDQYTTAYDLAHLGAMAMRYRKIAETVSVSSIEISALNPADRVYPLRNTNQFLPEAESEYATDGIVGLKSGSTEAAGACLVLAKRERGGNLIIAVVLGSELAYDEAGMIATDGRWDDMRAILTSISETYAWINPESENDVPGLANEMAAWQVALKEDSGLIVPRERRAEVTYRLELLPEGPSESDAGRVLFFAGTDPIGERPLIFR